MTSILTNTSSMVALQTLKGINSNLNQVQNEISTGKSISSAKDNSAIWAISKVMESDVSGFEAISESLALGESSIAVAQNAAETVTDLLTKMKSKIVAAQEENVDREKIQTDIDALTDQIQSVVGAAQFNGLNFIDGTSTSDVKVLSSLDRDSDGNVSSSTIDVARQNLSTTTPVTAQSFGTGNLANQAAAEVYLDSTAGAPLFDGTAYATDGSNHEDIAADGSTTVTVGQVAEGVSYEMQLIGLDVNVVGGGSATAARTFQYVANATDGTADVAQNLAKQMSAFFEAATDSGYTAVVQNDNEIVITNGTGGSSAGTIELGLRVRTGGTPGSSSSSGGLGALQTIDVTTDSGATGALNAIEGLIQTSIDAAAEFGSAAGRIETQSNFVTSLSDSMKTGIGVMVDADMEEASARLQALQVQQQLGIQALSIANQAPQSVLSLFR